MLQQSLLPASTCTRRRRGRWLWVTTLVFIANVSLRTLRQALPGCVTVHRLPRMMDPKETGQALTHTPTNSAECPLAKHKSPAKKNLDGRQKNLHPSPADPPAQYNIHVLPLQCPLGMPSLCLRGPPPGDHAEQLDPSKMKLLETFMNLAKALQDCRNFREKGRVGT